MVSTTSLLNHQRQSYSGPTYTWEDEAKGRGFPCILNSQLNCMQESSANVDSRKGEEVNNGIIISVQIMSSGHLPDIFLIIMLKVLASLLQMELVTPASSKRLARWELG